MAASNFAQFTATLNRWPRTIELRLDELVREVSFTCAENMIVGGAYAPGTPVDTGNARASWWVRIGDGPAGGGGGVPNSLTWVNGDGAAIGQVKLHEAALTLLGAKAGDAVYLLNSAAYIGELEYGHSMQAPAGFVRLTLAAGQKIVDAAALKIVGAM